jgi:type I restriction enzyme, S subunit
MKRSANVRIGDCCTVGDGAHASIARQERGMMYLTSKNFKPDGLDLTKVDYISEEDFNKHFRQDSKAVTKPLPGDVLVSIIGSLGEPYVVKRQDSFGLSSSVAILRPDPNVLLPQYLFYWMRDEAFQSAVYGTKGGVAQSYLSLEMIRSLPVRLPRLSEQQAIVTTLAAYDSLIDNNTKRIRILEQMAQMFYREWFVNFQFPGHDKAEIVKSKMGPIPRGWTASTVGELCQETRRAVNPSEIPAETPYIGLEHMPRKSIALSLWGKVGEVQSTKLRFRRGEILFGKIRPYFHKVGVAPIDGVCSSDAIVIVPKAVEYFPAVLTCVSSDDFVRQATQTSQGTKMPRANWDVLCRYTIALPDKLLLDRFNALITPMVELIQNLVLRNRCLSKGRDILLPKLVSGEVNVEQLESEAIAQNA